MFTTSHNLRWHVCELSPCVLNMTNINKHYKGFMASATHNCTTVESQTQSGGRFCITVRLAPSITYAYTYPYTFIFEAWSISVHVHTYVHIRLLHLDGIGVYIRVLQNRGAIRHEDLW